MEDAMILNKASFERGFAHASVYKSEVRTSICTLCTTLVACVFDS